MERNADLTSMKGLGRRFSWENFLKYDTGSFLEDDNHYAPDIACDCFDG